jgi:hypothetical protein
MSSTEVKYLATCLTEAITRAEKGIGITLAEAEEIRKPLVKLAAAIRYCRWDAVRMQFHWAYMDQNMRPGEYFIGGRLHSSGPQLGRPTAQVWVGDQLMAAGSPLKLLDKNEQVLPNPPRILSAAENLLGAIQDADLLLPTSTKLADSFAQLGSAIAGTELQIIRDRFRSAFNSRTARLPKKNGRAYLEKGAKDIFIPPAAGIETSESRAVRNIAMRAKDLALCIERDENATVIEAARKALGDALSLQRAPVEAEENNATYAEHETAIIKGIADALGVTEAELKESHDKPAHFDVNSPEYLAAQRKLTDALCAEGSEESDPDCDALIANDPMMRDLLDDDKPIGEEDLPPGVVYQDVDFSALEKLVIDGFKYVDDGTWKSKPLRPMIGDAFSTENLSDEEAEGFNIPFYEQPSPTGRSKKGQTIGYNYNVNLSFPYFKELERAIRRNTMSPVFGAPYGLQHGINSTEDFYASIAPPAVPDSIVKKNDRILEFNNGNTVYVGEARTHFTAPLREEEFRAFLQNLEGEFTYRVPMDVVIDLMDRLDAVPGNSDYNTWIYVGMALRERFGFTPKLGLVLWRYWSKKGSNFNETILRSKWESFK